MQVQGSFNDADARAPVAAWCAVFAMSLCVFVLIASEFMPVSLLTPIASDLAYDGRRGGSGHFRVRHLCRRNEPFDRFHGRRIDRKVLLLALTGLMLASGLIVALAANTPSS